ncbi:hypothetical protein, partial [Thermogutta sp.]|uniref:hypothetical protein n=1 Tax=Thermogutta sp. TaxID=1962930 RepID=UPI00321F9E80
MNNQPVTVNGHTVSLSDPSSSGRRGWRQITGFFALLLLFLLGMVPAIRATGVLVKNYSFYHDEIWNAPQAVSLLRGECWRRAYSLPVGRLALPVVSGPYQGAIKTYLLVPWIACFGTSPLSLRSANVALFAFFLAAMYWALRPVSRQLAALSLLLPWALPATTTFVPTDHGPFLVAWILIAMGLGFLARFATAHTEGALVSAVACFSLLVTDKITNTPVAVVGITAVALLALRTKQTKLLLRPATLGALALPLLPWVIYFASNGFNELLANTAGPSLPVMQRAARFFPSLFAALTGRHEAVVLTGKWPQHFSLLLFPFLVSIPLLMCLVTLFRKVTASSLFWSLFTGALVGVFCFIAIPGLTRPWHYLPFYPILLFLSFFAVSRVPWKPLAALFFAAIVGLGVRDSVYHERVLSFLMSNPGTGYTSPALNQLLPKLRAHGVETVLCLNYSLCNPLFVLAGGKLQIIDATWWTEDPESWQRIVSLLSSRGRAAVWREILDAKQRNPQEIRWLNQKTIWGREMQRNPGPPLAT